MPCKDIPVCRLLEETDCMNHCLLPDSRRLPECKTNNVIRNEQVWDLSCQTNGYKDGVWCNVPTFISQMYQFTLCNSISFRMCWIWINTHWRLIICFVSYSAQASLGVKCTYLLFFIYIVWWPSHLKAPCSITTTDDFICKNTFVFLEGLKNRADREKSGKEAKFRREL
jgi:hypothetical protein